MPSLADIALRTSYHKGRDNIAQDFYLPCMRRSTRYDRAVGYFGSSIFIIAWSALRGFILRGGQIRILCSHVLSPADIEALDEGYIARADESLATMLSQEFRNMLANPDLEAPARILAGLVSEGALEFQIAVLPRGQLPGRGARIFHDKLGLFYDAEGNTVIFKGSMNETWSGLAEDGNLESVDVAATWMGSRDLARVQTERSYFDDLWNNNFPGLLVRPFPAISKAELLREAPSDWADKLDSMIDPQPKGGKNKDPRGRSLLPHQSAVLSAWANNGRSGIVAFATGAGKTFTAITAIREAIQQKSETPIVIVPDQVLFKQWLKELETTCTDLGLMILRAGAGYSRWRRTLREWTKPQGGTRLVLATVQTARTNGFRNSLSKGSHLFLVADEVHRLGSKQNRALLQESNFGARLGLSATPERAGDPEGTAAIFNFFKGVLEPRYTLADALRDRILCPYFYRAHAISLSQNEAARWLKYTADIRRLHGRLSRADKHDVLQRRIKHLELLRAKVVKQATCKTALATKILAEEFQSGQRWIVYCDDRTQLDTVCDSLMANGLPALPFHSQMQGDREETLRWLDRNGGIVVAIKCLDEGVDIPSVTHALILASSKNPREFIQRRGRVLRAATNKSLAYLHDAIVTPPAPQSASPNDCFDSIVYGELARAIEFARHAENSAGIADLREIALATGTRIGELTPTGIEDE